MSRDSLQDGLPMYVEGADLFDPGAMGTLTVSTDDPGVTRTLRTEQASIFDALDDADDAPRDRVTADYHRPVWHVFQNGSKVAGPVTYAAASTRHLAGPNDSRIVHADDLPPTEPAR